MLDAEVALRPVYKRPYPATTDSDQGSQYASRAYRKLAACWGMTVSMSRRANARDNTPMESFFKTLKVERIYQTRYETRAQARLDIALRFKLRKRSWLHDLCTWKRGRVSMRTCI